MNKDSYKIVAAPLYFIAAAIFNIGSEISRPNSEIMPIVYTVMYIMMLILAWYHLISRDSK